MGTRRRALAAVATAVALACPVAVVSSTSATSAPAPAAAAAPPELPAGFQDTIAIGGLSEPVAVAFAPDGTAFIALKTGVIKSFDYLPSGQFEPFVDHVNVTNLDVQVNNYWDRGLTGITVDPQFGTAGNNFIYVNYAYNRDPRDTPAIVPKWGNAGQQYDECANPAAMPSGPNPAVSGCVINIRVSRIPVAKQASGWIASGAEQPLLEGACMQFPSHASGDVVFGPDGWLYASAGDGASFDTEDWGQANNPCGDPADEGGSLRSQDIRTSGDPLSISGAIFRVNKANGNAPNGSTSNADRIVTVGQRNPWRMAFRPGTSELWSGDVGGSIWEEVNRTDMSSFTGPVNLGWPCYEGSLTGAERQPGWDSLDKPMCENLYAAGASAVRAPYFSYRTRGGGLLTPGENCQQGTSSVSGIAFIPTTSSYPAEFRGSMFFNDYARGCIWRLGKLPNGDPDPNSILPFVEAAETPVGIEVGPGGDLYYVDYGIVNGVPTGGAGDIHRITYTTGNRPPVAAVTATPSAGPAPLDVSFSASGSTDPDGDSLTYEWALDGDGVFNDGGGVTKTKTYSGTTPVTVQVRVNDGRGGVDTEQVVVSPGNSPPSITGMSPAASLTWAVGETINFSATATDPQQTLADSAFTWSLTIQHCPSVCHSHPLTTWSGQRTGSFPAPDHEWPSDLLLQVTVTDSQGLTDTETVQLDPKSVPMTFASSPTGAALTVAGAGVFAPHNQTFIQGSNFNVSAPPTREVGGANYSFTSWSDGGAATHAVVAPASATTLTATYTRQNRLPTVTVGATPTSGPAPLTVSFTTSASDPDGDNAGFTYEWALDGDGVFNDGGGATKQKQYATSGSRTVQVRVTDSHGGQDTDQVTVNVGAANQPPVAAITTTPASPTGPAPFNVGYSASGSSDPDSDPLTYAWDLDNDGAFDDGTGATASRTYAVGTHTVRLQVTDSIGATNVATTTVTSTNQAPVAVIAPANPSGPAPLTVNVDANGSSDPNGHTLTYAWDLDNDGAFDDATGATASRSYPVGDHVVRVRATDPFGLTGVAQVTVASGNTAPVLGAVTPAAGTRWSVGEAIAFSASATDDQDGTLPASAFSWKLEKVECASGCSPVVVATTEDVTSGTFPAPELTLPAHLLLSVTAADSRGTPDTETVRLDPRTVDLTFATSPAGMDVDLARSTSTPTTRTVIVGSRVTVTAPERQRLGPRLYQFASWSDGGARTHVVAAPATAQTYLASYEPVRRRVTLLTRPGGLEVKVGGKDRADGWARLFAVGESVKVTAPKRQWHDGVLWEFVRWSDGGNRMHRVVVPDGRLALRAVYRRV